MYNKRVKAGGIFECGGADTSARFRASEITPVYRR